MNFTRLARYLAGACALSFALRLGAQTQYATPYSFTTLAGTSSAGFRDGPGNTAQFFGPGNLVTDAAGNVFVADEGNHTIRRITPAGEVSTLAGQPGVSGTADGSGSAARFTAPHGLAIDFAGNLFVADTGNHAIRRVTPAGVVATIAGLGGVAGNTDGVGSAARFNQPFGLAVDPVGNLFVTDTGNDLIRKITTTGAVTTLTTADFIPTVGGAPSNDYGAIAADAAGNIVVSRFLAVNWRTHTPLTQDYSMDYIGFITRYPAVGGPTDLWQTTVSIGMQGRQTGEFVAGLAFKPTGELVTASLPVALDQAGNFYYSDTDNNTVLKRTPTGGTTVLAGVPESTTRLTLDGSAATARFTFPVGIAVDAAGNAYVTDRESHCIRKISADGTVSTLAGVAGEAGTADGTGTVARFNSPRGITLAPNGMLYVADSGSHTIRRIGPGGETHTIAGKPNDYGLNDGVGTEARFFSPMGIAADATGNLYVTMASSHSTVRRIAPDGTVTSLGAGGYWYGRPVDSPGVSREFNLLAGIATDPAGNVYVTDLHPSSSSLHKISPTGVVSTLVDRSTLFALLLGLTVDSAGNIFAVDAFKQTVFKITPGGINPIAGLLDSPGSADGLGVQARFFNPQGIAMNPAGTLYVTSGTTVRKGQLGTAISITTQPQGTSVAAGGTAQFSVTATGAPAPTYQWQFNGTTIAGATGSTFNLSGARPADAGSYTVVVTNALGSVTSNAAALTLTTTPTNPPSNPGGGGGSGGGGAPSAWFLLALLAAGAARAGRARHT